MRHAVDPAETESPTNADRRFSASQWQLIWWSFRRHKLALTAAPVLGLLYLLAIFSEFIAPYTARERFAELLLAPPHTIHFVAPEGGLRLPFVYGYRRERDPETFRRHFVEQHAERYPLRLFVRGPEYKFWGLIRADLHLFGAPGGQVFLFGTDHLGRDLFSRIVYGARISLTIGLVGVALSLFLGVMPFWDGILFHNQNESLLTSSGNIIHDELGNMVGNVLHSFEVSDGDRVFTLRLRKGLRWSDGVPVTMEDVLFAYEDVLLNEKLTPSFPRWLRDSGAADGQAMTLEVIDDHTFRISFTQPYGRFLVQLAIDGWRGYEELIKPKHYLKQFHADYTPLDDLADMIKERSLAAGEWWNLFHAKDIIRWEQFPPERVGFPVLNPWVVTDVQETVSILERNPYYFKVDTEGQQLPYIDKHQMVFVSNAQNNAIRMMAGDLDFFLDGSVLKDVPLYKENESKGGYRTLLTPVHFHYATVWLNHTHADPVWKQMVAEHRFRQALNLAINRDEIIDSVYIGLVGKPKVFALAEYDTERASQLLDAVGLDKRNADGWRLGPDGNVFEIPFESSSYLGDEPLVAELIVEHLREVGLQATTKTIDGGLWGQRLSASEIKATVNRNHGVMWSIPVFDDLLPGSRGWGNAWQKWYTSGGAEGEEPPTGVQRLYELREEMMLVKPGTPEDTAIVDEMFSLIKENLWFINVVEDETWPMLASTRLANIPHAGSGAAITFSAEQWFFDS